MPTTKRITGAWIVVKQLSTKRRFPARASAREQYQRMKDFSVLKQSFPTREKARAYIRSH